jgi:rod shape-determining protein MreC
VSQRPSRLLAALVLVSLTLLALDSRASSPFDPLRTAFDAVLGPVDAAAGRAGRALARLGAGDGDEVRRLREENARLAAELARGQADARRLEEWEALLATAPPRAVPARVTGLGSGPGERTLELDVGSRDGVTEGRPVVAAGGLVGRTVRVGPSTSTVLAVDDPGSGVGARLARTGALGLARGAGPGRLAFVQVDPGPVEVGDALLTTGSGTFPPDLPVGRVLEVGTGSGGLTTTAVVEAAVAVGRLEAVLVLVDDEGPG